MCPWALNKLWHYYCIAKEFRIHRNQHSINRKCPHSLLVTMPGQGYRTHFCLSRTLSSGQSNWFSSVQFSRSAISDCLWPHGLQHARPRCPSPTPGVHSNSCPSSWWCHPTISFSVIPFSSHLQSFPGSGPFPMSQFFASGGQSIGASASASLLPMNIQDWFPVGLTGLISLQSKGLL